MRLYAYEENGKLYDANRYYKDYNIDRAKYYNSYYNSSLAIGPDKSDDKISLNFDEKAEETMLLDLESRNYSKKEIEGSKALKNRLSYVGQTIMRNPEIYKKTLDLEDKVLSATKHNILFGGTVVITKNGMSIK